MFLFISLHHYLQQRPITRQAWNKRVKALKVDHKTSSSDSCLFIGDGKLTLKRRLLTAPQSWRWAGFSVLYKPGHSLKLQEFCYKRQQYICIFYLCLLCTSSCLYNVPFAPCHSDLFFHRGSNSSCHVTFKDSVRYFVAHRHTCTDTF